MTVKRHAEKFSWALVGEGVEKFSHLRDLQLALNALAINAIEGHFSHGP